MLACAEAATGRWVSAAPAAQMTMRGAAAEATVARQRLIAGPPELIRMLQETLDESNVPEDSELD